MDPIINMELHKPEFTKNDFQIYTVIMANPEQVTYATTSRLAETCGVSQSALSRFVRTLGYDRYQDFRSDITSWIAQQQTTSDPERLPYFERLERLLRGAEQALTDEYMRKLASYVRGFDRLYATGIGKSLDPARLMQRLLYKAEIVVDVCPLDVLREYADHMKPSDLLIVFSVSGQADVMARTLGTEGKVMLVTTNVSHPYQEQVDCTVILPFLPPDPETCSVSPVLFDVFVELLVGYITSK